MTSRPKVMCDVCDEQPLVPFEDYDEIVIGYHCKSKNPSTDMISFDEVGCSRLIPETTYRERFKALFATVQPQQQAQQQQQQQQQQHNLADHGVQFHRIQYDPQFPQMPLMNIMNPAQRRAVEMKQMAELRKQQGLNQPIQPGDSYKPLSYMQQSQIPLNAIVPTQVQPGINIGYRPLTYIERQTQALKSQTEEDRVKELKKRLEISKQAMSEKNCPDKLRQNAVKKLKFVPRNTSSEEEMEREAAEKKKNRFKRPPKKKKNKVLKEPKEKKAKKNGDESELDDDDDDDDDDDGSEEGDWDSDEEEEESELSDDELFPETEADRLDEEADEINNLLGDDSTTRSKVAHDVFEKNLPVYRVDHLSGEKKSWHGFSNDQCEVFLAPFVPPKISAAFDAVLPKDESRKDTQLGVNWNNLRAVKPGETKWKPVTEIPKELVEVKTETELALEEYQKNRLEKAMKRIVIPKDYKPLVVWSPTPETIAANPDLKLIPIEVPPIVGYRLRPHQRAGVQFLAECVLHQRGFNGAGAILADDMGLGKTLQSVALIYTLLCHGFLPSQPVCKKVIVCCPTSLVQNWANEFDKWIGKGVVYVVPMVENGPKQKQTLQAFTKGPGQVLVISYDTLRRHMKSILYPDDGKSRKKSENGDDLLDDDDDDFLEKQSICDLLICDEAHRLKNNDTQTYRSLNEIPCKRRVLLSGTPMQNELKEFYSMINFANPDLLGSLEQFSKKFQNPIIQGREPDAPRHIKVLGDQAAYELGRITAKFILRRTNTLLSEHLPPKNIEVVCTKLSPLQRTLYDIVTQEKSILALVASGGDDESLALELMGMSGGGGMGGGDDDDDDDGGGGSRKTASKKAKKGPSDPPDVQILPMLNLLRGISNHPKIVYDQLHRKDVRNSLDEKLIKCFPSDFHKNGSHPSFSGKLQTLDRLICSVRSTSDDRFVLISNFTETLDLIQQMCEFRGHKYLRVDGGTSIKNRQANVDKLCAKGSDYAIFLLSSRAGGCGLNLIGANRLVLIDPDWNPAVDKQAAGRIWRDGQTKRCFVYRFLSTGTIDEKIFQRQLSKDGLTEIMGGENQDANVTSDELRKLFVYNSSSPSDTHDTLDCHCLEKHVVNGKVACGEEPDHIARLWTTPQNPFGRVPAGEKDDIQRCTYPYELPPPKGAIIEAENNNNDGNEMEEISVPIFPDPALPRNENNEALPHGTTIQQPINPITANSKSPLRPTPLTTSLSSSSFGSGKDLPNLLQKGWAREADLEYWSHHSNLSTVPDPCFRDAIIDRGKKTNFAAFGDDADNMRINPQYSCTMNMVSMVLTLEVTGKPLAKDPDGRNWRMVSSLTFRHGQPIKSKTKGNNYSNTLQLEEIDEEDLTAAEKRKRLERKKKLDKLNSAKFDASAFVFDSEEDPEDNDCDESRPKGKLPDHLITNPDMKRDRIERFQRQLMRFTTTREKYEQAVKRGIVPAKRNSKQPSVENNKKKNYSDSDCSDSGSDGGKRKRPKPNAKNIKNTKTTKTTKTTENNNDENEFSDNNNDDVDNSGNVVGLVGSSSEEAITDFDDDDDNNNEGSSDSSSSSDSGGEQEPEISKKSQPQASIRNNRRLSSNSKTDQSTTKSKANEKAIKSNRKNDKKVVLDDDDSKSDSEDTKPQPIKNLAKPRSNSKKVKYDENDGDNGDGDDNGDDKPTKPISTKPNSTPIKSPPTKSLPKKTSPPKPTPTKSTPTKATVILDEDDDDDNDDEHVSLFSVHLSDDSSSGNIPSTPNVDTDLDIKARVSTPSKLNSPRKSNSNSNNMAEFPNSAKKRSRQDMTPTKSSPIREQPRRSTRATPALVKAYDEGSSGEQTSSSQLSTHTVTPSKIKNRMDYDYAIDQTISDSSLKYDDDFEFPLFEEEEEKVPITAPTKSVTSKLPPGNKLTLKPLTKTTASLSAKTADAGSDEELI